MQLRTERVQGPRPQRRIRSSAVPGVPADGHGEVLLVEDDIDLRLALTTIAAAEGIVLHAVAELVEARQHLVWCQPRLVVIDWHLRGSTATELVEQVLATGAALRVFTSDPAGAAAVVSRYGVEIVRKAGDGDTLRAVVTPPAAPAPAEATGDGAAADPLADAVDGRLTEAPDASHEPAQA